jgi:hypothetical protein
MAYPNTEAVDKSVDETGGDFEDQPYVDSRFKRKKSRQYEIPNVAPPHLAYSFFSRENHYGMKKIAESKPETVNYIPGVILTGLTLPLHEGMRVINNSKVDLFLPLIWNYSDALCSIYNGIYLMTTAYDEKNKPNGDLIYTKGVLNLISGIQLILFTWRDLWTFLPKDVMPFWVGTNLAGPSFAIAMLIDLICAAIDFHMAKEKLQKAPFASEEYDIALTEYKAASVNLVLKTFSFIGMSLLALASFGCPFLMLPGLIVVSMVAAAYLYKYSYGNETMYDVMTDFMHTAWERVKAGFSGIQEEVSEDASKVSMPEPDSSGLVLA